MNNQTTMRVRIVSADLEAVSPNANANIEADMHLDIEINGDTETVDLKTLLQMMIYRFDDLDNRVGVLEDAELP